METRTCKYCGETHPLEQYEVTNVVKGVTYRRRRCHKCYMACKNERRKKIVEWYREHKKTLQCEDCGYDDFRSLEFHHHNGRKEFNVGDMARRGFSIKRIEKEIAKCQVLCANCHRIRHWEDW
jgi:hypothetical protein